MMNMQTYKIHWALLLIIGMIAAFCSCSEEEPVYTPAAKPVGEQVFFPSSPKALYEVKGTSGELTFDVMRVLSANALDASLKITYGQGAESVFTIPASVNFAAGDTLSTLTIRYDNLVRGTTYTAEVTLADETPYGISTINVSVLYPDEVVYEWETVSEEAIYTDQLFSMFGAKDYQRTKITVEKAKDYDLYRFRSPYDNEYMAYLYGEGSLFPADFEAPYIILDGEKYKEQAPGKYYIAITPLGFKMVNGVGPSYDPEWDTFGSIAGNLASGGSPIPPTSTDYPLGTYDRKKKTFDLGAVFHQLDGNNGGFVIIDGGFSLSLDPALLNPDYDRDYTWSDVEDATGYFFSELAGQGWMQEVQVSKEDPTFYRMTNPYTDTEKAHLYFYLDEEGSVRLPKGQDVGLTTFGTTVYVEGKSGASSWDAENEKLTLGLTLYIADEEGKKTGEITSVTETFLWGQTELDQLEKGKRIDDYVGTWAVPFTDGEEFLGYAPVTLSKKDETTLVASGLSGKDTPDDVILEYSASDGLLTFAAQYSDSIAGYQTIAAPFDYKTSELNLSDVLVGGLKKDGSLLFVNDEANTGYRNSICFFAVQGGSILGYLTHFAELNWTRAAESKTMASPLRSSVNLRQTPVKIDNSPRRSFSTDLQIAPKPVKGLKTRKAIERADSPVLLGK